MRLFYNLGVPGSIPETHDYYGATEARWAEFARDAILAADADIDFSQYDADGDGTVDAVAIIHQGRGKEESGKATDIWSHQSSLSGAGLGALTLDGVTVDTYIIMPEVQGAGGDITTIGVLAHEYGHALGLPDLYDVDYSSAGIGDWGLMGGGAWLQVSRAGDSPAHMVAGSK